MKATNASSWKELPSPYEPNAIDPVMKIMVSLSHTKTIIPAWCIFLCGIPVVWGQENRPPTDTRRTAQISAQQEKLILENVEKLSSPEYRKRAAATKRLIEIGIPAIPHIGRKANDDDPESRQRCFQILRKLATGETPETSSAALKELESLTSSANKKTLVDARHTMNQIRHGYRSMMREMVVFAETHDKQNDVYAVALDLSEIGGKDGPKKTIAFHLLQHLWKIESINLNDAKLDAQSLVWLGTLTHLETLEMKNFDFGDGGLGFLEKLKRLKKLELPSTSISDKNMESFRGLTNLEYCNLSGTKISNRGLKSFQCLSKLKDLNLAGTNIDDGGMAFLASCPNIEVLRLKDTGVSDQTLSLIGGLKKLRILSLSGTKITDKGLVHLKNLKCLKTLWLSRTKVTADGELQLAKSLHPEIDIWR